MLADLQFKSQPLNNSKCDIGRNSPSMGILSYCYIYIYIFNFVKLTGWNMQLMTKNFCTTSFSIFGNYLLNNYIDFEVSQNNLRDSHFTEGWKVELILLLLDYKKDKEVIQSCSKHKRRPCMIKRNLKYSCMEGKRYSSDLFSFDQKVGTS